jgi:hypothetical protein
MDIQACSLNLVMSFLLEMPCDLAKGARMYSMVAARRPVSSTVQNITKWPSAQPRP